MPANGRRDLIRRLKVKRTIIYKFTVTVPYWTVQAHCCRYSDVPAIVTRTPSTSLRPIQSPIECVSGAPSPRLSGWGGGGEADNLPPPSSHAGVKNDGTCPLPYMPSR
jgi:hypothetical protein